MGTLVIGPHTKGGRLYYHSKSALFLTFSSPLSFKLDFLL